MARDADALEQDRADLLAALEEARERPIRADDLIAAAAGTTVAAHPDATWGARLRTGLSDLRYLRRRGHLATPHPTVRAWDRVDYPDSEVGELADVIEDREELRRMLGEWVPTDG